MTLGSVNNTGKKPLGSVGMDPRLQQQLDDDDVSSRARGGSGKGAAQQTARAQPGTQHATRSASLAAERAAQGRVAGAHTQSAPPRAVRTGMNAGRAGAANAANTAQPSAADVQRFIEGGGLAQALAASPQNRAQLQQTLSGLTRGLASDQAKLDGLAQRFDLGRASGMSTSAPSTSGARTAAGATGRAASAASVPGGRSGTASAQAAFNPLDSLGSIGGLDGVGGGGGSFEDRVFGMMIKVTEDFQKQIEQRLEKLQQEAQAAQATAAAGGQDTGGESRNIEFEKIKYDMQKLSQMQQAMSNVLNSMDELAKSAIHHIKAS